jgi:hypothetical protein
MDRHVRLEQQLQDLIRRDALRRRDFLRVAASVGAVGAGAVLLGACGSDDGNGSSPSTPGIVIDPPPETTTIRLPSMSPSQNWPRSISPSSFCRRKGSPTCSTSTYCVSAAPTRSSSRAR